MNTRVVVRFPEDEYELRPATRAEPDEASRWLDDQFVSLAGRSRESAGETPAADKALAVATAAGPGMFLNTDVWTERYAASVLGALDRDFVRVDVVDRAVTD